MADRYVRIDIFSKGADAVKRDFRDIKASADDLKKPHDVPVDVKDADAKKRLDALSLKLDFLKRDAKDIPLTVKDDRFNIQILNARAKLDDLKKKAEDNKLGLNTDRFHAEVIKAELELDGLKRKARSVNLGSTAKEGFLAGLEQSAVRAIFGKIGPPVGNERGGGGGEGGSVISGLFSGGVGQGLAAGGPALYGSLGGFLASLIPSVIGFGVGGLTGAGGIGLSALFASQSAKTIKLDQAAVNAAKTKQAKLTAQTQLQQDTSATQPFTDFQANARNLLTPLMGIITPFTKALNPLLVQLGKFEQAVGPELSKMFMASMPFIKAFLSVLEQGGKSLIPAFTETMQEMVKSGALKEMTDALVILLKDGLVPFLKVLGPGMKASAIIFKATIIALSGVLVGIGALSTFIAREFELFGHAITDVGKIFYSFGRVIAALLTGNWKALGNAVKALGNNFRNFFATLANMLDAGFVKLSRFGHDVAGIFDKIRHWVASAWDSTWTEVGHAFQSFYNGFQRVMGNFRHFVASEFDDLRHNVAASWDFLWNTVSKSASQSFHSIENDLRSWWHNIANGFDILRHGVARTWDVMWGDVKSLTRDAVRGVSTAIHGIEGAFRTPVAWVVNNVWDRLAGIWNKITGIVHLGSLKLPAPHFAQGGVVPGHASEGDTRLVYTTPGERILSLGQVAMLGGHGAIDAMVGRGSGGPLHYAGGGIVGGIGGLLSHIGRDLLSWVTKPLSFITSHIFGGIEDMLGNIPGSSPAMNQVLKSLSMSLLKNLSGAFRSAGQTSGKFGNAPPGSGPYQAYARKLFPRFGWGVNQWPPFNAIVMQESGWNPNAQNPTSTAYGIGQFLDTTWATVGGHKTSNPYLQIFYMEEYIKQRYNTPGAAEAFHLAHNSYAKGGWINEPIVGTGLRSGQTYSFGELGPEHISPAGSHAGGGVVINVMVAGDSDPDGAALRIVQKLRDLKRHKGGQALGIG